MLLLRREGREDRSEEIPDHEGRVLHLRAADAALGSARRHGHAQHRSLHGADQRRIQGQGRADALHCHSSTTRPSDEDRATGFLIPTYGNSTIKGHSLHDAFFWAIDRSQDATFYHDWFSKTGQGYGSEYRYNLGGGSDGSIRTYLLNQKKRSIRWQASRSRASLPAGRSYEIRGGANQLLPGNLQARARVDYFSSIQSMQTTNTNIYDSSRNQRSIGGNVVGAWGSLLAERDLGPFRMLSPYGTADQNASSLSGTWPRLTLSRNERPILGSRRSISRSAPT